jgi:pSer/pThr/pTyr-binding forkhead associated (FHA) protein
MLGKLVPCGGGIPIPLLRQTLVLGRKPECDITISCASVSSRHCVLEFKYGVWWVRDLESKNGTAVNGQRGAQLRIDPKDILTVGRQRMIMNYKLPQKGAKKTTSRDREEDLAFKFLNDLPEQTPSPPKTAEAIPMARAEPVAPQVAQSVASAKEISRPTAVPSRAEQITPLSTPDHPSARDLGKLVPCGGGLPIPLRSEELILGRGSECDVRIRFPSVSSRHCKLRFEQGYWLVEDLHSTNGTWVDGDRCMLECLMPESVLALDKHRFTIHYSPRGSGQPPMVRRLFSQSLLEKAGLAAQFSGDRLGGMQLPDDDFDRPKRYNLLDSGDEST